MPAPAAAGLLARLLPAIQRMAGSAFAGRAAKAVASGGSAKAIKPDGSPFPASMHATSTASRAAQKIEEDKAEEARQASQATKDLIKSFAMGPPIVGAAFLALKGFSAKLLEGQRVFAQYNGRTANAFAQLDVNRIHRDIRQGANNAGSTEGLARALDSLEEALLPLETVITELLNRGAIVLIELAKPLIDGLVTSAQVMDKLVEVMSFGKVDPIDDQVFADMAAAKARRESGMPTGLQNFLGGLGRGLGDFGEPTSLAIWRSKMAQGGYSHTARVQAESRRNAEWQRNRVADRAARRRASTEATKQRRRAENEARRRGGGGGGGGAFPVLEGEQG